MYMNIRENQINVDGTLIDVVSDLHIDQWSPNYNNKYPCGKISNHPHKFKKTDAKILVVAGDVSDDLELTIKYLNEISEYYEKILFVDGNHEHVTAYPELFSREEIYTKIRSKKIIYLPKTPYRVKNTIFIGASGWWDYDNFSSEETEKNTEYFKYWIKKFSRKQNIDFIMNVIERSTLEFNLLENLLKKYENNPTIDNIVIVTHTVPKREYCYLEQHHTSATQHNTKFDKLLKYKKISHWIFGHAHNSTDEKNDIHFISNPRGRPEDYNRIEYDVKQITV